MGSEAIYATQGYGFLCLPRNITQRLVEAHYHFDESDAWLDLWCHTVWQEPGNAFSHMAPVIQFGKYGAVLTLETLGHRWGWEKTKVWRFFKKHADAFPLQKLPGSLGCLIFNTGYPAGTSFSLPESNQIRNAGSTNVFTLACFCVHSWPNSSLCPICMSLGSIAASPPVNSMIKSQ